ncbi:hypothetical protein CIG75_03010 [Tumebacillus algifaecis]|uniref:Thymidylate kinase n=1 Tax=Tumebacillus algifaecis TaxID=1214604 RepID=A0A223CXN3_9BACL|nr:hypothetical protein [Tumebacillus algifaecis]ASS74052.1 hypothetical protein CIG75_03010 [Tumebacillus algifaecis]
MSQEKGLLIAFEGAGRSGKSSLIRLLREKLEQSGRDTAFTEWNSYPGTQELIDDKKLHFTFNPLTYSVLHLADFALRHEEIVRPALEQGQVVLADRWIYTPLTRDVARGISSEYIRQCYSFASSADLVFYVEVPVEVALERHRTTKGYYNHNAGTDIWPDVSHEDAFRLYHRRLTDLYGELLVTEGFVKLDGLKTPEELLVDMWTHVERLLGER